MASPACEALLRDTILTVIIDGLDGGAETHECAVFLRVWEIGVQVPGCTSNRNSSWLGMFASQIGRRA